MKTPIKNSVKHFGLTFLVLLAAFIFGAGCTTQPKTNIMKKTLKNRLNNIVPFFTILMSALIFECGCNTSRPASDPLADFHVSSLGNLDSNKAITDDYKDYIQKLSPEEKKYLGPVFYFEDGTGQHAVRIETDIGGKDCWYHILFYDKDNKRIKVIKYFYGRYIS